MNKIILALTLALAACSPMVYSHGIPNLAQVDANIYRSGQIEMQEGWDYIATLAHGRQVHVVKLNFEHEGTDALAIAMGFDVHYLPIQPEGDQDWWDDIMAVFRHPDQSRLDEGEAVLLHCLQNPATDFCLGHCTHGQDRTGILFGEHRVLHDGWTKDEAYQEMLEHNFHSSLHGVNDAWEEWQP